MTMDLDDLLTEISCALEGQNEVDALKALVIQASTSIMRVSKSQPEAEALAGHISMEIMAIVMENWETVSAMSTNSLSDMTGTRH